MSEIACAIINSVVLIVFGLLAYHFNHWWVVLFAYFFLYRKSHEGGDNE